MAACCQTKERQGEAYSKVSEDLTGSMLCDKAASHPCARARGTCRLTPLTSPPQKLCVGAGVAAIERE